VSDVQRLILPSGLLLLSASLMSSLFMSVGASIPLLLVVQTFERLGREQSWRVVSRCISPTTNSSIPILVHSMESNSSCYPEGSDANDNVKAKVEQSFYNGPNDIESHEAQSCDSDQSQQSFKT